MHPLKNKQKKTTPKKTSYLLKSQIRALHKKWRENDPSSIQTAGKAFNNGIPCKWNVGDAVPCHCQELQDTEEECQTFLLPPKHST